MSKQGRTKTISFPKKDYDIKGYLGNLDNMSEYLINLVRENLQKRGIEIDAEGNVIAINNSLEESTVGNVENQKLDMILESIDQLKQMINDKSFVKSSDTDDAVELKPQVKVKLNRLLNSIISED